MMVEIATPIVMGMTREKIAKAIGVDTRTLQRWMSGDRKIPYVAQFALECLLFDFD